MSKVRLYNATFVTNTASKVRLYRAQMTGTAATAPKVRLYRAQMTGTAAVIVNPLTAVTGGPGEVLTFTATLVGGGSADSWLFRRISGPPATFVGTGATRTVAVASVHPDQIAVLGPLVIGVTATVGAVVSPEVTVAVPVLPQLSWSLTGTTGVATWVGARVVPA